ncbi:hypothetical protein ACIGC1_07200 [Peribacillus butanolivorans]|uniref:hypothetical protein n=1 Tax=Peribacillus butanolivorans TaxID=421767 RepID=UPI0037CAB4DE
MRKLKAANKVELEVAGFGKMSQSGNSLLGLIQNNDLPILDLLIREAVQNSLDAALPHESIDSVFVDIGVKTIDVPNFTKHLKGVEQSLNSRYGQSMQKAIYVEDSNTVGLTGPINYKGISEQDAGNIYKLIYGISMARTSPGSGGSWGLGKTIYFRVGIGLVVYYSRILNDDGTYEHRLAATLVENENSADAIIPNEGQTWSRGIAWWGQKIDKHSTIPITDEVEIRSILSALSMEPFDGGRTGTKIIIPFIDEQKLLIKTEQNEYDNKWWESDLRQYMKIALQRWYASRLDNKKYPNGKWLNGHINGEVVTREDFLPLFYEVQRLYNMAILDNKKTKNSLYYVNDIQLKNTFQHNKANNAGRIAYKIYSKQELGMTPPNNGPSPFASTNKKNIGEVRNAPLITYVRKPGMLVNYETIGAWCEGIERTEEDEFLIGVFVPNSDTKLLNGTKDVPDLEAYLRKSEMADHTSWSDIVLHTHLFNIVSKIQSHVRKKIKATYDKKETATETQGTNILARQIGKMLLPPTGFGKRASSKKRAGQGKRNEPKLKIVRGNSFTIVKQKYNSNNTIELQFALKLSKKTLGATLELFISTENGRISARDWESEDGVGTAFPASIIQIDILKSGNTIEMITYKQTENLQTYAVKIDKINEILDCMGTLVFLYTDPHIQVSISMKPEGSDQHG